MERGLVSCEWLAQSLQQGSPRLRIVDATWFLPNSPFACPVEGSSAAALHAKGPRLPGSAFLDVDAVADLSVPLPHMMPKPEVLGKALAALGISRETEVVVYDQLGVFSSPRLWYTLRAYGFPSVAVLDGGLPLWLKQGREVEEGPPGSPPAPATEEAWTLNERMVWDVERVVANVKEPSALLVDARPAGRFTGAVPEPRAGMRGGRVPGSANVPFLDLLTADRTLKAPEELAATFKSAGVSLESSAPPLVASCGSGLTACIVGLALRQLDYPVEERWAVYDGSWAEYGARDDTPIVKAGENGEDVVVGPAAKI